MVESINEAQAEREAARAELANAPARTLLTEDDVNAMIDALGDVGRALDRADPHKLQELYERMGLEMTYDPEPRTLETAVTLGRRDSARVRGGT
ncbi:hypothetical protein [Saccharopolyspora hordei]|uniref:hypothetical protein n=1 Tax=Saccharopolyspora hordei TaxID=1838 RepID=UPI0015CEA6FB|nr:hypothetical protein [Saccharopolyspora hordei]